MSHMVRSSMKLPAHYFNKNKTLKKRIKDRWKKWARKNKCSLIIKEEKV